MVKGSKLEVCWMLKLTVEEVALMPATVPLSLIKPLAMALVPLPIRLKPGAKELAPVPPLPTANWPVKLGTKVKVLAVEVLMLIKMLVSEVVAMAMAGPVRAEMEVIAEVR